MDDETDIWLEALSGRSAGDPRAPAREASALRTALRRLLVGHAPERPARDAFREASLIERARRAGLISPPPRSSPWRRLASAPSIAALTAVCAAFALFLVLRPALTPRPSSQTEVVRGTGAGEVVRLHAADPEALKRTLLEELHRQGVEATGYERLGVPGIDADLPTPLPERVRAVLDRHRIPVPADAVLRIEIFPAAP